MERKAKQEAKQLDAEAKDHFIRIFNQMVQQNVQKVDADFAALHHKCKTELALAKHREEENERFKCTKLTVKEKLEELMPAFVVDEAHADSIEDICQTFWADMS